MEEDVLKDSIEEPYLTSAKMTIHHNLEDLYSALSIRV